MKEMQERLGTDPELAAALPRRRTSATSPPGRARRGRQSVPEIDGSPPAACPTGSSACTCSPASRSPQGRGVEPARRRGARPARRLVGVRAVRRPTVTSTVMTASRDRLRHQHDQAADRRPARRRRSREREADASGSDRASTAPAGSPTRRWSARSPRSTSTPRMIAAHDVDRGSASARPRPPATRATPPSSPPASAAARRRARGASPATRRPRCPSPARSATCATTRPRRCWSSTSAAGRPS